MFSFFKLLFHSFGLVYSSSLTNNYTDYILQNNITYNHDNHLAYEGNVNFINTMIGIGTRTEIKGFRR